MPIDPILMLIPVLSTAAILILAALALVRVTRSHVLGTPRVLWVLLIIFVPVLGPVCWFLVGPDPKEAKENN